MANSEDTTKKPVYRFLSKVFLSEIQQLNLADYPSAVGVDSLSASVNKMDQGKSLITDKRDDADKIKISPKKQDVVKISGVKK